MTITKEQAERAENMVRELQTALDYAYQGLRTLPTDHSARVLYEQADTWLRKPWA